MRISVAPRCKSVLVARSLDRFTRHTQSFNVYALLTLPFGQTLAMGHRQGLPEGQDQSSIHIEGLRVPCEPVQAPRDQYGLTSRSQRCSRAQPPRAVQSLDSHTLCAAGGWIGGPRRRSDEGCVRRLTQRGRVAPKKLAAAFGRVRLGRTGLEP